MIERAINHFFRSCHELSRIEQAREWDEEGSLTRSFLRDLIRRQQGEESPPFDRPQAAIPNPRRKSAGTPAGRTADPAAAAVDDDDDEEQQQEQEP